ncbi:MAG: hypothetical protein ACI9G1_004376, partial [Pirellulaceae bacterium]
MVFVSRAVVTATVIVVPVRGFAVRGFAVRGFAVRGFAVRGFAVRGFAVRGCAVCGFAVRGFAVRGCAVCQMTLHAITVERPLPGVGHRFAALMYMPTSQHRMCSKGDQQCTTSEEHEELCSQGTLQSGKLAVRDIGSQ